jgi:hypothetical protein
MPPAVASGAGAPFYSIRARLRLCSSRLWPRNLPCGNRARRDCGPEPWRRRAREVRRPPSAASARRQQRTGREPPLNWRRTYVQRHPIDVDGEFVGTSPRGDSLHARTEEPQGSIRVGVRTAAEHHTDCRADLPQAHSRPIQEHVNDGCRNRKKPFALCCRQQQGCLGVGDLKGHRAQFTMTDGTQWDATSRSDVSSDDQQLPPAPRTDSMRNAIAQRSARRVAAFSFASPVRRFTLRSAFGAPRATSREGKHSDAGRCASLR